MRSQVKSVRALRLEKLESRQVLTTLTTLAELAAIGVDQEAIDLISNVNGDFEGDVGVNDPSSPDLPFTDFVLDEQTLRNTVDAIAASESVPADAIELTAVSQFVGATSQLSSGTASSPNRYVLRGDFTLANNQTINVSSNVEVYVDGSIFKRGNFTSPAANTGTNNSDAIFRINGTDNIRLIGVDSAELRSNPSYNPSDPHTSAVIITGFADNVTFEGFHTRFFWNAVNAQFNTSNVVVRDNVIADSINRSVWFLGTSGSAVHHNFISNVGMDTIDFDAYTADSDAYENVLIGAERFTFFVEEGANNNFSARQLSIIYRYDQSPRPGSFQLGNASNGTSPEFVASPNNLGEFTRDNFFLDNVTYAPTSQQFRGEFIATGDNGVVGNTYFYGNRSFSAGFGRERPPFGRDNTVRAIYGDRLPGEEILAARDPRFDAERGFRSYDLLEELRALDARFNETPVPVRSEILPAPVIPRTVYQESDGLAVIEAESYTNQQFGSGSADGQFFGLLVDDDLGGLETSPGDSAVGAQGVVVERNLGTNTGNALNGPRLDYEIDFVTAGVYNVHLRMRATDANQTEAPNFNDSIHIGLDGVAVTNESGFGVGTDSPTWEFTNDVLDGVQDITINVATPGRHTLNLWAREDGTELDRIVLSTDATAPTGFGPSASPTLAVSPLAGDYDLDLDVDDDDRTEWAAQFGSSESTWVDGNGDGVVNAADYTLWRDAADGIASRLQATADSSAFLSRASQTATKAYRIDSDPGVADITSAEANSVSIVQAPETALIYRADRGAGLTGTLPFRAHTRGWSDPTTAPSHDRAARLLLIDSAFASNDSESEDQALAEEEDALLDSSQGLDESLASL